MRNTKIYYDTIRTIKDQAEFLSQPHPEEEKKAVAQLPVLILEVATGLRRETVTSLSDLVRELFDPGCLLDIRVVSDVIAGARVVWKGVYFDGSIINLIDANKEEINKIIWSHFNTT